MLKIPYNIPRQGPIEIDDCYLVDKTDKIAVIYIDCRTKRPAVGPLGLESINLCKNEFTVDPLEGTDYSCTQLSFPDFSYDDGWTVMACQGSKYELWATYLHKENWHGA